MAEDSLAPPEDRSDLLAMGAWVADCLDERNQLVLRTVDRFLARAGKAVHQAVTELDAEHAPTWTSADGKAAGKEPIGCQVCFPGDGSWPCVTRMVADDLRRLL